VFADSIKDDLVELGVVVGDKLDCCC